MPAPSYGIPGDRVQILRSTRGADGYCAVVHPAALGFLPDWRNTDEIAGYVVLCIQISHWFVLLPELYWLRLVRMNKAKRSLFNFWLGTITCVLLIGLSTVPAWSKTASNRFVQSVDVLSFSTSQAAQPAQIQNPINQHLIADLQEAESVLMAQDMSGSSLSSLQRYVAILTKNNVVPNAPSTIATGVAGAALAGDRLIVRGDFGGLSSALRDYATDPVNPPNLSITSAAHIHRGEPNQNGPFQYALTVMLNDTGLGGRLSGEYTLTPDQLQALSDGQLYVDIHTKQNRAGELRGIFRPL